jgi:Xaa-Pro dipeptidase
MKNLLNLYNRRITRFLNKMKEQADVALFLPGKNLFYLTGISPQATLERLFAYLIYRDGKTTLIAPRLYENEIDPQIATQCFFWSDSDDPYMLLRNELTHFSDLKIIMMIEKNTPAFFLLKLKEFIDIENIAFSDDILSSFRVIKDDDEVSLILRAAYIIDETFSKLLKSDIKGKTERQVAALIDYIMKTLGASSPSFDTIVAAGENGANPHHSPSDRVIKDGDALVLDFGAVYNGYCSDITRTVVIKKSSPDVEAVYNIVAEAQQKAIESVKENMPVKKIDETARKVIEAHNFGEFFIHRTGHGIGLDIHESPYITNTNEEVLKNGMVFTIEPGIYLQGKFGIRIEDDILVKDKATVLTKSTKELVITG